MRKTVETIGFCLVGVGMFAGSVALAWYGLPAIWRNMPWFWFG